MAKSVKIIEMSDFVKSDEVKEKYELTAAENSYTPGVLVLFVTEVLGTAMLMFLGCMGVCVPEIVDMPVVPHFGGLCFGLTVLIVIQTLGHISGAHLNPQVTMASVILGQLKPLLALVYFAAEFIGALLGFGLLKLVSPSQYPEAACETLPHKDVSIAQALGIEIVITCFLILVCGGVWDPRNAAKVDSVPVRFGFTIAGFAMIAGPLTGASMNTARSFAPALINGHWEHQWIYWVGPTVGALIGALFYRFVLSAPKNKNL